MRNYKIAVAGTGYVGLSLGVLLSQHHQVVAVDIVQAKVDMINNKKSPIQDKRSAGKFSKCYGGYYREHSVNAKVARAIKTVFYALDVVNQGMQEKQSITVRCMDIEDLEKQAEAIRAEQIKL